jgi:hypothetical protein
MLVNDICDSFIVAYTSRKIDISTAIELLIIMKVFRIVTYFISVLDRDDLKKKK